MSASVPVAWASGPVGAPLNTLRLSFVWPVEAPGWKTIPLYLAPQPDTRDEAIREKDAEIARLREYYAAAESLAGTGLIAAKTEQFVRVIKARAALATPQPQGGE